MKNNLYFKVLLLLIILTILAAFVVRLDIGLKVAAAITLALFMIKFLSVAFYFMELKKAHIFWKSAILIFVSIFLTIILISV
ncbi:MAG: cytochrome C oxidase subunit IV family protein [Lutibacter sp.]|nr:cytochrome C oxidase subunit IV family protein [Lutibacter sp.]